MACMWKVGSDRCPVSFPVCAPPPLEAGEGGRGEGRHEQRKREFFGLAFGNILASDKDFSGFDGYQYCLLVMYAKVLPSYLASQMLVLHSKYV